MSVATSVPEWKPLSEVARHRMGGTPSTAVDEYWANGDVPWATPADLGRDQLGRLHSTERKITVEGLRARNVDLFPVGTVLLSTTATIGNVSIAEVPTYCNQQITAIVAGPDVLPEYLGYFLLFARPSVARLGGTSTATHINQKSLATLRIPIRPLDEQRRIVDLLSRAENIVRMRREAEQKAKEIIPTLFLDMFGDPATNPKVWKVLPVGDVIRSAEYGTSAKASEDRTGMPVIRMGNVDVTGRLSLTDLKYVELPEAEQRKYRLGRGDILFNRTNSKELVGKTGIWRSTEPALAASYFIRMRVNEDMILPDYFWAFMNTQHMKSVLYSNARGAIGQSNINAQELRAFVIPCPPTSLQNRFAQRVAEALELEGQQSLANRAARTAFQSLLAGLISEGWLT